MRTILWALVAVGIIFIAACDETTGLTGKNSLIKMTDEPAGEICADGGIKIETGIDNNGNGTLDPEEVKDIRYVCNGEGGMDGLDGENGESGEDGENGADGLDGTGCTVTDNGNGTKTITCGNDTTVTVSDGAAGADGADGDDCTVTDNGNGSKTITCGDTVVTVSDGDEGAAGHNSLVVIEDAPAGTCPNGGQKVTVGIDQNDNDTLDIDEITATKYICAGVDGNDSLTVIDPVAPGDDCEAGGYEILNGVDTDGDDLLDAGEVVSDVFVCNGVDGEDGEDGQNGAEGHSAMTEITTLEPGDGGCVAGGYLFKTGVDLNDDGELDDGEYEETIICNGVDGENGEDGVCAGNHAPVITGITIDPPDGYDDTYMLDIPYTVTVTVTDEDGDTPTYKMIGGYATIAPGAAANEFELTPRAAGGPFTYAVIVSDGCQITMGDLTVEEVMGDPWGGPYFGGPPFLWFTDITGDGFTVNWMEAYDDFTATEDLEYKVVYATDPDEIDTIEEIEEDGNGTVAMDWTVDTTSFAITGLEDGVEYTVVVLVRDEYHLMDMYIPGTQATPDVTAPATTGGIFFEDIDTNELTVLWTPATDNATEPEFIEYKVVYSTDPADIDTELKVNDLMSGDWRILVDWQTETYDYFIDWLDEGDLYFFNVLARDEAGNVFMYGVTSTRTLDVTVPDDLANLYAIGLNDRACFRWDDAGDFSLDYYEVSWTPDGPTEPLQVPADSFFRCIDGLTNGTEYTFTIVAVDGIDQRSGEVTVTATPADPGMGYAITGNSTLLYRVDPSTAQTTLIGDTGISYVASLALDPADGSAYVIQNNGVNALYGIDLDTAEVTYIDPTGHSYCSDAAFSANGVLYAWDQGDGYLITIDPETGIGTKVGDSGVSTSGTAIAFDADGLFWALAKNKLYLIEPTTGAVTYNADVDFQPFLAENGDTHSYLHNALDISQNGVGFSVVRNDTTTYLYAFSTDARVAIPIGDMGVPQINAFELEGHTFVPIDQHFSGIQRFVPTDQLTDWAVCYTDTYGDGGTALADILSDCDGDNLMIACRPVGSSVFTLAAWAPRTDVLYDTGNANLDVTHAANGVEWYYSDDLSWGFAPGGATVAKNACDYDPSNPTPTNPELRLCWHTDNGDATLSPGYRCGNNELNDSSWERIVLQYTPE